MADLNGQERGTFKYFDKGNMAIIGRNAGVAELSKVFLGVHLRGVLGWLGWLFIHLVYLPGYRDRVSVFSDWAYNYFTWDRRARLITDMTPSPAEVSDREGAPVSDPQTAERGRKAQFAAR